jgi:hypothetical protein
MKYLLVVFVTLAFAACGTAPATQSKPQAASPTAVNTTTAPPQASIDPVVKFLLTSAAGDFHDHGPKGPLHFRNVRLGHVMDAKGEAQYRLCGELFREGDKAEWTPFATIKTSGYEQYVGPTTYCPDSLTWDSLDEDGM